MTFPSGVIEVCKNNIDSIWSQVKAKEEVVLFKRKIMFETILKALTVATFGITIVIVLTMVLSFIEPGHDFIKYLFEAALAFGTVGLSMGLTTELSPIGGYFYFDYVCWEIGALDIGFRHDKKAL